MRFSRRARGVQHLLISEKEDWSDVQAKPDAKSQAGEQRERFWPHHSCRNAITGSARAARRAGM